MDTIETKIDEAFRNTFLLPREKLLTDFFADILDSKYQFREDDREIEVISVYYYASEPLSFLFARPCEEYYDEDKTHQEAELHLNEHSLEDYSYLDVEELCRKVLDENNIDYSEHIDDFDYLDPANYWENQFDLELDFILNCWKNAKERTQSEIWGFLAASDGAGSTYDLDNGDEVSDDDIDGYLQSKGYHFKKEIS